MKIRKTLCTISLFLHIVAFLVLSWPLKAGNERRDLLKRREVVALDSLPSERYFALHGALDNFFVRVKIDKEASVAFLGGSITAGEGWRNKVMRYLEQAYPDTKFTFLNAGVPSLGSVPHAFRLERDVFDKGPVDLLFVESAVNDLANATPPDHQRRALEGIVRQAKEKNPFINVVLMAFVDEEKIADYAAGGVPPEVALHKKIATHYDLPFINLAKEVSDRIGAGEFSWEKDFIDLHPSPFGHRLYARTITEMLSKCASAASASKLVPGKLPGPLDRFNYDFGRYLPVGEAQDLRGFSLESSWHA